jgi:hypothetical protein
MRGIYGRVASGDLLNQSIDGLTILRYKLMHGTNDMNNSQSIVQHEVNYTSHGPVGVDPPELLCFSRYCNSVTA